MTEVNQQQVQQTQPTHQESQGAVNNNFSIPEPYQGKDWAKSIKTADDLWKLTDNAQSLIGKRPAGIPSSDAPDEEWNKFYNALGRPEKPDLYQLPDIEGLPEGADLSPYKQKAASIAHEVGLSPKQAEKLWNLYIKEELGAVSKTKEAQEAKQKELDAEYDKITAEVFGDKYDVSAKAAQDLITRHVPEEMIEAYQSLADNPKAMAAVIKALSGANEEIAKLKKEYGAEGTITSGSQTTGQSIEDIRKELATLRTSKEARDFTHPDNKKTMDRIAELSGAVKQHYSK